MYTALNTLPSLEGKPREVRVLFADVANEALAKGRNQDEAIFQALAAVKQKEQKEVKKFVKPIVPRHLQVLLDIKKGSQSSLEPPEELEIEKSTTDSQSNNKEVVGATFDSKGRLVLKFKDGTNITSNVAPITAVETSVVVIGDGNGGTGGTPIGDENIDGGSATSVYLPEEIIDGGDSNG